MRVTGPLLKVLALLEDQAPEPMYGLEISRRTGLKSGTLYPLLDRLEAQRWVRGSWQDSDVGPRRKFYVLTRIGVVEAHNVLIEYGMAQGLAWS